MALPIIHILVSHIFNFELGISELICLLTLHYVKPLSHIDTEQFTQLTQFHKITSVCSYHISFTVIFELQHIELIYINPVILIYY